MTKKFDKKLTRKSWLKPTLTKKVDFDLSMKSTVKNGNLGAENDIRVRTIIKQADMDTQLIILL